MVGALRPELVKGNGDCRREMGRGFARIPAVLSTLDFRLGVGVREFGDVVFPEMVCVSCEDGASVQRLRSFSYRL